MTSILVKIDKITEASLWCTVNIGEWGHDGWYYQYQGNQCDYEYVEFIIKDAWKLFEFCGKMRGNIIEDN